MGDRLPILTAFGTEDMPHVMNAKYLLSLVCLLALSSLGIAQMPAVHRAILLDDFSVVEGHTLHVGTIFRVTNGDRTRTLSQNHVLFEAASVEEIYQFVLGKMDVTTVAGAAQMAAWCDKNAMYDRAIGHARSVLASNPTDAVLLESIRKLEAKAARVVVKKPAHQATQAAAALPANDDLSTEATLSFGTKVQPLLMNVCASCHAQKTDKSAFKLSRVREGYIDAEATATNRKIVANQLSRANPTGSPFLEMLVTAHGGQKLASLPNRNHPAYRNLETWVLSAVPAVVTPRASLAAKAEMPMVVTAELQRPASVAPIAKSPAQSNDPYDATAFNALPKK